MDIHQFHDDLSHFSNAKTIDELTNILRYFATQLQFDHFIYALRIPTQFSQSRVVMVRGYPEEWLSHYFENAFYENDPVIKHCSQSLVPVEWHEIDLSNNSAAKRVMDEAVEFGLKTGVSMPVHSPLGEFGILSLTVNSHELTAREITQAAIPYMQLMAVYLHESLHRILALSTNNIKPMLTAREQECLRLAADGKTYWEISQLINLSERTVNFHLNNLMTKLDVTNRQHAIAKSILQQIIKPHPF